MAEAHDPIAELLIAARRNQILDAATNVFAEKGFHRATIKDIAKTAGIADGTIYTYFASKADLLLGILNRLNETEVRGQQFTEGSERDFRSFLVAYLRHRMSLLWPNAEVFRAVLPELLVNPHLREMYYQQVIAPTMLLAEQYFQTQMEHGYVRKVDVSLAARASAGMILGLLVLQLLGDEQVALRWEELAEVLVTLIFDGLRPPSSEASVEPQRNARE